MKLIFSNGDSEKCEVDFNPAVYAAWQFAAAKAIAPADYTSVTFVFTYSHNINRFWFTQGFVYKEPYGQSYDYDKDGNVVSTVDLAKTEATFAYQNDMLTKLCNPTGSRYIYSVDRDDPDSKKAPEHAFSSNGQQVNITYDSHGNPLTTEIVGLNVDTLVSGKTYYVLNAASGRALDAGGATVGDSTYKYTYMHPWMGGNTWQQWKLEATSLATEFRLLSEQFPGQALDVYGTTESGARLITAP